MIAIPGAESSPLTGSVLAELARPWLDQGFATLTVTDSRFTPLEAKNIPPVAGVVDHTAAEWGLWVNRPLLGQWTWDLVRWLDFLEEQARTGAGSGRESWKPARPYVLFGIGSMSLPCAPRGALDIRVDGVACEACLVSYVCREGKAWSGHPMGLLAPGILELADVGHLAALLAPRPFVLTSAVEPDGGRGRAGPNPVRIRLHAANLPSARPVESGQDCRTSRFGNLHPKILKPAQPPVPAADLGGFDVHSRRV